MNRRIRHLLAWLWIATLGACQRAPGRDDCVGGAPLGPGVDGGLKCGELYDLREAGDDPGPRAPGRFAVKVVQYLHMSSAGLVETDTIASAIGWADLSYADDAVVGRMDLKLCHLEVPRIDIPGQPEPSTLLLLPSTLEHVPPPGVALTLGGDESCASFITEPNVVLLAARLVDRLQDPLPWDTSTQTCESPDATGCLWDQDKDGKPAVTFLAENFPALPVDEVYATLRSWVVLDGMVAHSDLVLGTAYFGLELQVVGCRLQPLSGDRRRCNKDEVEVMATIAPVITQSPETDSTFVGVRVDPATECPEIIERADLLFGR